MLTNVTLPRFPQMNVSCYEEGKFLNGGRHLLFTITNHDLLSAKVLK